MTCAGCGELGAGEIAQTGYGERLSAAWGRCQRFDLSAEIDIGRCPDCGSLYEWTDHPQFYGSGNLDEEHLRRLDEPEASLVRALLPGAPGLVDPAAWIAAALTAVPPMLLKVLLMELAYRADARLAPMLPALLDMQYRPHPAFNTDVLSTYAGSSHRRTRPLLALIEADPRPRPYAVQWLLERCRQTLAAPE